MAPHTRDSLLARVKHYFASVMREDMSAVRSCFTPDATITILHGDSPRRLFRLKDTDGPESLVHFYGHLWSNYVVRFYDFTYIIDAESDGGSCYFQVTLTPKPGSPSADAGALQLNNCNFFRFDNGVIAGMTIYYANPTLGAAMGNTQNAPTAFPKT